MRGLAWAICCSLLSCVVRSCPPASAGSAAVDYVLLVNDPLTDGSTIGTRTGGEWVPGTGWKAAKCGDYIRYCVNPGISDGKWQFDVKGLGQDDPTCCDEGGGGQLCVMDDGFTHPRHSVDLLKFCTQGGDRVNELELHTWLEGADAVCHTSALSWNPATTYRFEITWDGRAYKVFRDGVLLGTACGAGPFDPSNHYLRIGSGTYKGGIVRNMGVPGALYSNVKVYRKILPPPGPVTGFAAVPKAGRVQLSWTNPGDSSFAGTMIRYKTSGYPTDAMDGVLIAKKSNSPGTRDGYLHAGCENGATCYYAAFAYGSTQACSSAVNASATPNAPADTAVLLVKQAGGIVIDGRPDDWNLSEFTTPTRAGEGETGDIAVIGYDGGTLHYAAACPGYSLPTSAADHTAKVYSRHDATYQYFLVRCNDDDIRTPNGADTNWANDCVEFFIDPGHDHGSSAMGDSTSDVQLVIDAANRKNVYMCADAYRDRVLNGVRSAVVADAAGWQLEVAVEKSVLDPDLPAVGTFGIDFNFRDNDDDNDKAGTTVYTWGDTRQSEGFPSKIPDKWGDASLQ